MPLSKLDRNLTMPPNTFFAYSSNMEYLALGGLEIIDVLTSHVTTVAIKDNRLNPTNDPIMSNIDQFMWHPTENWLITMSAWPVYLLNVVNVDGTTQRELALCSSSPSCFGWLPDIKTLN